MRKEILKTVGWASLTVGAQVVGALAGFKLQTSIAEIMPKKNIAINNKKRF